MIWAYKSAMAQLHITGDMATFLPRTKFTALPKCNEILGSEQAPAPCRHAGIRGLLSPEMRQDVKSHVSQSIPHDFP